MAVGRPVVVTPEVGLAAQVERLKTGLVLKGDPATLGKGIQNLLEDKSLRSGMSERGRQAVLDHFTWDVVAQKMVEVYRKILAGASVPGPSEC